jgi:hypothetical protein
LTVSGSVREQKRRCSFFEGKREREEKGAGNITTAQKARKKPKDFQQKRWVVYYYYYNYILLYISWSQETLAEYEPTKERDIIIIGGSKKVDVDTQTRKYNERIPCHHRSTRIKQGWSRMYISGGTRFGGPRNSFSVSFLSVKDIKKSCVQKNGSNFLRRKKQV